jgi:hypothetical protein
MLTGSVNVVGLFGRDFRAIRKNFSFSSLEELLFRLFAIEWPAQRKLSECPRTLLIDRPYSRIAQNRKTRSSLTARRVFLFLEIAGWIIQIPHTLRG